ncbi:MAG: tetraacyldisaccharide 4'-kinase [Leptothrix ochracea]
MPPKARAPARQHAERAICAQHVVKTTLGARIEASWRTGGALQWSLRPAALLFSTLVATRRTLYRWGWLASQNLPVPVVVIGNRVVGGAGKTPLTIALVEALRAEGWHPGVISRGYGRRNASSVLAVQPQSRAEDVGDEPLLIQRRTHVPLWVGRNRVEAGQALLQAHPEVDVLLCDDGLQHLPLRRDVEIVVFDERGAGNGWLLPAGPLREPIRVHSDVPQLVFYNAAHRSTDLQGPCGERQLDRLLSLADWWQGGSDSPDPLAELIQRPVLACAGIGQPERFFEALRQRGLAHLQTLALPDHHDFQTAPWPWPADTPDVIVTEKDAVKIDPARLAQDCPGLRLWVAPLTLKLPPAFIKSVMASL